MCVIPGRFCACCPALRGLLSPVAGPCCSDNLWLRPPPIAHLSVDLRFTCANWRFFKKAAMQTKKEMSSQWENISCKSLVASENQRLLNLCGAEDVLLIFQSLRFRIEIITQNRKFCKSFDKIAALVTKINYVSCFFCASYPWQLRAMEGIAVLQGTPKLNRSIRL